MYGLPPPALKARVEDMLELVGLRDRAQDRVETYSRGMKQRLHLARGLLSRPEVLLLDEPTIGLDPVASREIRDLVRQLNQQGTTVFLTTHYMAEAEELCGRVAFLSDGRIAQMASPRELTRLMSELSRIEAELPAGTPATAVVELRAIPGVRGVEATDLEGGALRLSI